MREYEYLQLDILSWPFLSGQAENVALKLARYVDSQGYCWPSQFTLARDTGLSLRSVQRTLNTLEEQGIILIIRGAKRTTYRFKHMMEDGMTQPKEQTHVTESHEEDSNILSISSSPSKRDKTGKITTRVTTDSSLSRYRGGAEKKFDLFYASYPRKLAKGAARAAFTKACKKIDPEIIIAASHAYAKHCEEMGTEKQFIPHPATWLNAERWDDDLEDEAANPTKSAWDKAINEI